MYCSLQHGANVYDSLGVGDSRRCTIDSGVAAATKQGSVCTICSSLHRTIRFSNHLTRPDTTVNTSG